MTAIGKVLPGAVRWARHRFKRPSGSALRKWALGRPAEFFRYRLAGQSPWNISPRAPTGPLGYL